MEREEKLSIIVPVYNVENYLSECIDSILNQTYNNLEILLIDDGSTDSSLSICERYACIDKRVRLFRKENGGVSSARNLGLKMATGDYIGFVDSDDWIEPNMYKTMLNYIKRQKAEMCVLTKYIREGDNVSISNIRSSSLDRKEAMLSILSYNFPTSLWTSLYNKKSIYNQYLNEDIHHLEDFEFQFKLLSSIKKVAVCNEALYNYRSRLGSANSSGFNQKVTSCFKVLPPIKEYIQNNNIIDNKYISATNTRLTLTVGAFLAKSNAKNNKIERQLNKNARSIWFDTLRTKVPYKKKILIVLLAISYKAYAVPYKIIKKDASKRIEING